MVLSHSFSVTYLLDFVLEFSNCELLSFDMLRHFAYFELNEFYQTRDDNSDLGLNEVFWTPVLTCQHSFGQFGPHY